MQYELSGIWHDCNALHVDAEREYYRTERKQQLIISTKPMLIQRLPCPYYHKVNTRQRPCSEIGILVFSSFISMIHLF